MLIGLLFVSWVSFCFLSSSVLAGLLLLFLTVSHTWKFDYFIIAFRDVSVFKKNELDNLRSLFAQDGQSLCHWYHQINHPLTSWHKWYIFFAMTATQHIWRWSVIFRVQEYVLRISELQSMHWVLQRLVTFLSWPQLWFLYHSLDHCIK